MTNESEYDEIVNFIDNNMPEYNDGSLSIPEVIKDLHKRLEKSIELDSEKFSLLLEIIVELREYEKLPLSTQLKEKIFAWEQTEA